MEITTSYDINILKNYLNKTELSLINDTTLEENRLNEIILKQFKNRDIIVNFIDNLTKISFDFIDNISADFLELLTEVQEIFDKVNDSIKLLQGLKEEYSKICNDSVGLLLEIEKSSEDNQKCSEIIKELKQILNNYLLKKEELLSNVILVDSDVTTFLKKDILKKFSFYNETQNDNLDNKESPHFVKMFHSDKDVLPEKQHFNFLDESQVIDENNILLVSEKSKKVFLPYTKNELSLYLEQYPDSYSSLEDVVNKEFILSLDYYMKHPVLARFRETYSLIRDRESKSIIDAFRYAVNIMFQYNLNPVIIAACKTQEQLEHYLNCLEKNKLEDFNDFMIKFEVNPLA